MNKSDSERIAGLLEKSGGKSTSPKKADFLIANVCSVRQRAVDRVYALVKKWHKANKKIILTGCLLEQDKENLSSWVDRILPVQDIPLLPSLLQNKKYKIINKKFYLCLRPKYSNKFQVYVPIMNGCNNFCSYCVVPYTRGREVSRPAAEIIKEVRGMIKRGYKEITLLGQNVNSYKCKMTNQNVKIINFPKLLRMANNIPGNFWIRFITSHPKDMSRELIDTIAQCKKVCEYIHLPVQSGDNQILKKMNRKYTVQDYLHLIKKIRAKIPRVAISTDIIVGFPSETRKQFQNTVDLMKKVGFAMAYIARYSPRSQTAAAKLKDNVSDQEKKRRYRLLNTLLQKTAFENNQKLTGTLKTVLIERCQDGFCFGKTPSFKTVKMPGKNLQIGQFVPVKITDASAGGLFGQIKKPH